MGDLLGFVLSGLVSGALYALLATGLVLSYSASGLFNFAHGATAYLCALAFYELHSGFGWPAVPTALLLVCVAAPALGWGLDRLMFRKLARVGETAQIVATIGLLVALPAAGLWVVELLERAGAPVQPAENQFGLPGVGPSPAVSWQPLDGVGIDSDQLITWVATALVAAGLWVLMRHTRLGLRLRAAVDNRSLTELRGISADRLSSIAWMLSSGLAGLAGVLATPLLGLSAHDYTLFLFVSATAAVLGRFLSVPLAFAGGLGLGVLQNLVAGYASFAEDITGFRTAVPFLILFGGLVVLARRRRAAGTAAADPPPVDYLAGKGRVRRWGVWVVAGVLLATAFYTVTTPFWSGILAQGLAIGLVFMSFTVVTGLGAMVSLAQATFVTGAALVAGLLMSHGWPFVAAAAVGTAAAALLGAVVALPALRLGGRSLALATLALAFLADQVLFQVGWLRNGDTGWEIPRPVLGPLDLGDDRALGVALVLLSGAVVWLLTLLRGSRWGRAVLAVRSAPEAAAASGVSVVRTKLLVFTVSAGLAGFGGVLYASYNTRITATDFTAMTGLVWLAVVVAAGVRRPQFAVVAGLAFAVVPHLLATYVTESAHLPVILFGLAGLALANDPDGYCAALPSRWAARTAAVRGRGDAPRVEVPVERQVEVAVPVPVPEQAPAPDSASGPARDSSRDSSRSPVPAGATAVRRGPPEPVPRPGSEPPALALRGVRAGYGGAAVVHGVDLEVRGGEVLVLLGPNGAGKSTLCRVAAGLLRPSAGHVRVGGLDATRDDTVRRARRGVRLAPEGRGIFAGLSIEENLALQLPAPEDRDAVYARFPALASRRSVAAGSLSGGEQQILALAPLLQRPPAVLVADEPSLGLAPRVVDEVFRLLTELRASGTALLLVEEKAAEVLGVADTVAYLSQGGIAWSGPRSEVDTDRLAEAYLGTGVRR
ncbi:Branched amino acid transport system ATP-binding protein [Streptomyces venezuelae]|uniref:ABC transporter permease subunit n=1 Tax=Streptomyces gardneri TaxID=66892 RepID=UPI0006BD4CF9|nr:ATP-binding cassette domain-containing protein [Streptomyces gardneri]ALO12006.1 Branched amino acid transport system ATP-binding protein [Streptomyces venezuelae]QPK48850.1 ATP-binding cassette domain-containing protein [Streptomyces gardneri]WRK40332.1 ATP-binding cassette domain-containing protein [Streptomyces venezuelae]CUM37423.1 Branched-chain amino acid transport ATP-binding protein LivF (TC 3.A.1.4.1) [Streptomyces venezuelae]